MGTLVNSNKDKMKVVLALLVLAAAAYAAPEKRFIESISHAFESLGHAIAHTFNQAKDSFNNIVGEHGLNIDFHAVVQKMIPLIDSGMTETACTTACVGAASSVLGPAAPLAGTVCGPVCMAALAELEKQAGK